MRAIAKINLFLKVLDQRADGYHNLENVFLPIEDLYDDVTLEPAPSGGIRLLAEGPVPCETGDANLCVKAAQAFLRQTGQKLDAAIRLVKRIPVAAGLGGGSSDAAATLILLNDHFGHPLTDGALRAIASRLGADVPFFLAPRPALGTGIGDILSPLPIAPRFAVVLVTPGFPLPVAWSFTHLLPAPESAATLANFTAASAGNDIAALASCMRNDLEAAVFEKYPILTMLRETLAANGALAVHISGSGPSLFAISSCEAAPALADSIRRAYPSLPAPIIHEHR